MTREDFITHLSEVVNAVFLAEDRVLAKWPKWREHLNQTRDADPGTKEKTVKAYLRAVAEELLKSYSDEELAQLYQDDELNEL